MIRGASFVATLLLAAACASGEDRARIAVTGVLAPAPIATGEASGPMALYATIRNHGDRDDTLVAIETAAAGSASIHETVRRGGLATMAPVARLVIPAGARVRLEPAGTHVMLESLSRAYVPNDTLPVVFVFSNGRRIAATARVVPYDRLESALQREAQP